MEDLVCDFGEAEINVVRFYHSVLVLLPHYLTGNTLHLLSLSAWKVT